MLALRAAAEQLSVRQVEDLVKRYFWVLGAVVVMFSAVVSGLSVLTLTSSMSTYSASRSRMESTKAFYVAEADGLYRDGKYDLALRAYSKVLEYNAGNQDAWTFQVRMLIELGELREAKLWGARLVSANLRDANLTEASVIHADLTNANLSGAQLARRDAHVHAKKH